MLNCNCIWNKVEETLPAKSAVYLVTVEQITSQNNKRYLLDYMFFHKDHNKWFKGLKYDKERQLLPLTKDNMLNENERVVAWQTYQDIMYKPDFMENINKYTNSDIYNKDLLPEQVEHKFINLQYTRKANEIMENINVKDTYILNSRQKKILDNIYNMPDLIPYCHSTWLDGNIESIDIWYNKFKGIVIAKFKNEDCDKKLLLEMVGKAKCHGDKFDLQKGKEIAVNRLLYKAVKFISNYFIECRQEQDKAFNELKERCLMNRQYLVNEIDYLTK